jgi:hypothetical protein
MNSVDSDILLGICGLAGVVIYILTVFCQPNVFPNVIVFPDLLTSDNQLKVVLVLLISALFCMSVQSLVSVYHEKQESDRFMLHVELSKFCVDKMIPKNGSDGSGLCVIVGRQSCGKSTLIADIIANNRNVEWHRCNFIDLYADDGESARDAVRNVIQMQKRRGKDRVAAIAIDDYSYAPGCSIISNAVGAKDSRLFKIVSMQNLFPIPQPLKRAKVDYWFVFPQEDLTARELLYKELIVGNGIEDISIDVFYAVLSQCTLNYGCLVIDNTQRDSTTFTDRVYWYKADFQHLDSDTSEEEEQ